MPKRVKSGEDETMNTKVFLRLRRDDRDRLKTIAKKKHFTMVEYLRRMILKEIFQDDLLQEKQQQQINAQSNQNSQAVNK